MYTEPRIVGDEFVDFLLTSPSLEAILNFRLSDEGEERINALLEAHSAGVISREALAELDNYLVFEHAMRRAKIRAYALLHGSS